MLTFILTEIIAAVTDNEIVGDFLDFTPGTTITVADMIHHLSSGQPGRFVMDIPAHQIMAGDVAVAVLDTCVVFGDTFGEPTTLPSGMLRFGSAHWLRPATDVVTISRLFG